MLRHTVRPAVVLTGVALVTVVGAGSAFAANPPYPSSLHLTASKSSVTAKSKDTLTGTMHSAKQLVKGQRVTLEEKAAGAKSFVKVGSAVTNSKGQVTFTVTPAGTKGQKDQFELFYTATKEFRGSHSNVVVVSIA